MYATLLKNNVLTTCLLSLLAFHIADLPEIQKAESCEINEVPNTVTLGSGDGRVAWSAVMDKEPYVLMSPIFKFMNGKWEPVVERTFCQCVEFNYEANKCKKFRGNC